MDVQHHRVLRPATKPGGLVTKASTFVPSALSNSTFSLVARVTVRRNSSLMLVSQRSRAPFRDRVDLGRVVHVLDVRGDGAVARDLERLNLALAFEQLFELAVPQAHAREIRAAEFLVGEIDPLAVGRETERSTQRSSAASGSSVLRPPQESPRVAGCRRRHLPRRCRRSSCRPGSRPARLDPVVVGQALERLAAVGVVAATIHRSLL